MSQIADCLEMIILAQHSGTCDTSAIFFLALGMLVVWLLFLVAVFLTTELHKLLEKLKTLLSRLVEFLKYMFPINGGFLVLMEHTYYFSWAIQLWCSLLLSFFLASVFISIKAANKKKEEADAKAKEALKNVKDVMSTL